MRTLHLLSVWFEPYLYLTGIKLPMELCNDNRVLPYGKKVVSEATTTQKKLICTGNFMRKVLEIPLLECHGSRP